MYNNPPYLKKTVVCNNDVKNKPNCVSFRMFLESTLCIREIMLKC